MAVTCEDFRIDIAHEQSFKYLQAKQYDHNSRRRRLIITDSNVPITYSEDKTEYITLSMADGDDNYANVSCPFEDDGYPYITFTEGMLSRDGDIECELRIYDSEGGSIITTFTFMMTVSKSLLNQDRLVNSEEFNILNDLILQAITIPDLIKEFEASQTEINELIVQINNDIDSYQQEFGELSTEAQGLIDDVQEFLTTSQENEQTRITAEQQRVEAENIRVSSENERIEAENERNTAEETRKANEDNRISAESTRVSSENERIEAETNRTNAETERINTENDRIEAEQERASAEETRITAETNRVSAEEDREEAEALRQSNTATAIQNATNAANSANDAAERCEEAIAGIEYVLIDMDGGSANTEISEDDDDYNGGGA